MRRIAGTVDLPLSVDFEGGYALEPDAVAANVARIVAAGAIGINFEDGVVGRTTLHDITPHCRRIAAIRERAGHDGIALFINARTDLFLHEPDGHRHAGLLDQAIARARAYERAGASGFFAPGLLDETLIAALCAVTDLPVNILMTDTAPPAARLGELGVSRVSYGPLPFLRCMEHLRHQAAAT